MLRSPKTAASLAAVPLLLLVSGAAGAQAADNWGPTNAYYKGNMVASAAGYASNDRGLYAANRIKVTDKRNDGNTVYGQTTFYFFEKCLQETESWCQDKTLSTPETTGTVEVWLRRPLHPDAEKFRTSSKACAQLGFPVPDACSPSALVTVNY